MGVFPEQTKGVVYDLLPKGVVFDKIASVTATNGSVEYTYELTDNWRDTGRTLLTIYISSEEGVHNVRRSGLEFDSEYIISFYVLYPWEDLADYGTYLTNSAAYKTESGRLSSGRPDNGGTINEWKLLYDMDGDGNPSGIPNEYLYAQRVTSLNVVTASELGLTKRVRAGNISWTDGLDDSVIVNAGESYSYRLRIGSPLGTKTGNVVFYDALERYSPQNSGEQWRGILTGLDLSQPEGKGVAPVVYYSTSDIFSNSESFSFEQNRDLSNETLWSTTLPDDLAQVTAIAIDLSRKSDGSAFVLPEQETLVAIVHMRAPDEVLQLSAQQAHAYNNTYLSNTVYDSQGTGTDFVIASGYTKVGLPPAASLELPVTKTIPGDQYKQEDFTFILTPVTENAPMPEDGKEILTIAGTGTANFGEMLYEKPGTWVYEVEEQPGQSSYYSYDDTTYLVTVSVVSEDGELVASWSAKKADGASAEALTFTNEYLTGDLTVTKTLEGNDTDSSKDFAFSVTLSDTSISGTYSDVVFENGVATFTLKGGESKVIEGLPNGTGYTVEETDYSNDGYVTEKIGDTGTIDENTPAIASFTNTRDTFGSLTVSKTVSGNAASRTKAFTFTVTLSDATISGGYGGITFEDGVATFALKDGESKVIEGLPNGTSYTVVESNNSGYRVTKTGDTGTIVGGETATASFTNTKNSSSPSDPDAPPVPPKTGSLTISKTVTGTDGDTDKAFTFTVTLSVSGTYSYTGSKTGMISSGGTVELKHGESITISGLPEGTSYMVAESDNKGYEVTKSGDTGAIAANTTATAAFTNKKDADTPSTPSKPDTPDDPPTDPSKPSKPSEPDKPGDPSTPDKPHDPASPKTGDDSNLSLWRSLLLASFIGMGACIFGISRKKRKGAHLKK